VDNPAQTEHPDAAGWVFGVLDPDDSARFEEHLRSCEECQQAVAELGPAARLLQTALPAIELMENPEAPSDLEARTLARVEQAARKARWRRPASKATRLIAVAAAVVVAAVVATTISLTRSSAPALAFDFSLNAPNGGAASADATAQQTADGWSIRLSVHHLKPLPSGSFYECWYAGPDNSPARPDLVTAGTFTVDSSGNASVQMWSAADPRGFPTMEITAERPGDAAQHGAIVLSGSARTGLSSRTNRNLRMPLSFVLCRPWPE
jgi:anti-sigma-K factor RskA